VGVAPSDPGADALGVTLPTGAANASQKALFVTGEDSNDVFGVDALGYMSLTSPAAPLDDGGGIYVTDRDGGTGLVVETFTGSRSVSVGASDYSIGFFGATPVAQQAEPTTINEVVTLLQAYGLSA
jgi:hypothetical protein